MVTIKNIYLYIFFIYTKSIYFYLFIILVFNLNNLVLQIKCLINKMHYSQWWLFKNLVNKQHNLNIIKVIYKFWLNIGILFFVFGYMIL